MWNYPFSFKKFQPVHSIDHYWFRFRTFVKFALVGDERLHAIDDYWFCVPTFGECDVTKYDGVFSIHDYWFFISAFVEFDVAEHEPVHTIDHHWCCFPTFIKIGFIEEVWVQPINHYRVFEKIPPTKKAEPVYLTWATTLFLNTRNMQTIYTNYTISDPDLLPAEAVHTSLSGFTRQR